MQITKLVIENFKSIRKIELDNPNPFTVFVGPNGAGKSNIFEALEFVNISRTNGSVASLFGGYKGFMRRHREPNDLLIAQLVSPDFTYEMVYTTPKASFSDFRFPAIKNTILPIEADNTPSFRQFFGTFTRLFIRNQALTKLNFRGNDRLALDASNLEPVLKRILQNPVLRNEIFEWLELFIPGFKAVEVDDRNELHWFEESVPDYFTKDLISDGTYNILALLTAVYQSDDKPQFLCIEEPENGLHPEVILSLMNFFRKQCEEKGHYIWLNTHSETVVRQLTTDEIVLVNKRQGATQTKQVKGMNTYSLPTDEAWLTGALGGGLAW